MRNANYSDSKYVQGSTDSIRRKPSLHANGDPGMYVNEEIHERRPSTHFYPFPSGGDNSIRARASSLKANGMQSSLNDNSKQKVRMLTRL